MSELISWVKASLEGPDGLASHKKLSVAVLMILYVIIIIYSVIAAFSELNQIPQFVLYSVETMALLFSGINTVQSIKQKNAKD